MPHFPEAPPEAASLESRSLPATNEQETAERQPPSPRPRPPPNDPQRTLRLRTQTRRRRYLALNPSYFDGANLEPKDPLLYDRLVRRFQSPAERLAERSARGTADALEATLMRSEAKVEELRAPDVENPLVYERGEDGAIVGLEEDVSERVEGKEEGLRRWRDVMERRFLRGEDADFDYAVVDSGEGYDDLDEEARQEQEAWFDAEESEYDGDGSPKGETGVQDF